MKYPEYRLSMEAALPSSVQSWLGQQLELRGIDSLIYTRYIISLLQQVNIYELRRDFQQCGILTNVDSDMPVQPLFKLRTSK